MEENFYTRDYLSDLISKGWVEVGEHTYGKPTVWFWWEQKARLRIGRYCSIGPSVTVFLGGNHRTDWITTYPFSAIDMWPEAVAFEGHPATRGDVVIGNDVWLGDGCLIMSGVNIGDGAVVGARAVVSRDVPPYTIVAGNPARKVRDRFTPDVVAQLLDIRWWNLSDECVRKIIPHLLNDDVETFLKVVSTSHLNEGISAANRPD